MRKNQSFSETVLVWEMENLRERLHGTIKNGLDSWNVQAALDISQKLDALIVRYMRSRLSDEGKK
ncbi:MAG: aspartyl-phosphate phosphatase Spo0E family protein [Bacillota bacterium]